MITKKAKYKRCSECGSNKGLINNDIFGCDNCKKIIDLNDEIYKNRVAPFLQATVFYERDFDSQKTKRLIFCSWKCLFKKIKTYKNKPHIDFIALPYLSVLRDLRDQHCGDFFDCIKKVLK